MFPDTPQCNVKLLYGLLINYKCYTFYFNIEPYNKKTSTTYESYISIRVYLLSIYRLPDKQTISIHATTLEKVIKNKLDGTVFVFVTTLTFSLKSSYVKVNLKEVHS